MSVPQTPTRWTRTTASPGPGSFGPSISMRFHCLGVSRDRAFMAGLGYGCEVRRAFLPRVGGAHFDHGRRVAPERGAERALEVGVVRGVVVGGAERPREQA